MERWEDGSALKVFEQKEVVYTDLLGRLEKTDVVAVWMKKDRWRFRKPVKRGGEGLKTGVYWFIRLELQLLVCSGI